ncbi:MAG: GntR family transcriptional regulator [Burkholderiaceae bacterium]|nr:GntR family transcriptional regulator [Burkholderiaceae bacterium]
MSTATANRTVSRVPAKRKPAGTGARKSRIQSRPKSLTDQAYSKIEEMIVTLELAPGGAISESELSAHLGIGRTPVREALQRLAREHLVHIIPQRGILVSEIDIKRQLRLLETRREIERLVVKCAARRASAEEIIEFQELTKRFDRAAKTGDYESFIRADKEFNDLSLRAARNEFSAAAMGLMHGLSRRFWFMHHRQTDDTELMAKLHGAVSKAIADRNERMAARALDELIDHIEAFTMNTVSTDY